ncbi:MAG TPA: hypothetical protein VF407_12905 [Polyangiaceae bacterium]
MTIGCSANVGGNCFTAGGTSSSGSRVCGTTTCAAHSYCANESGNVCSDGCTKNADCLSNETCDLSNAVTDLGGNVVGSCKVKTLSEQEQDTCGDAGKKTDGGDAGETGDAGTKDAGAPVDAGHD